MQITVTFEKGTNPDIAQVQVQNKVQQALPRLPTQVQQQGLIVNKANPDFLMVVGLYDSTDRTTSGDVADYLVSTLQDTIGRIKGVGNFNVFGTQYAMRIWLDPYRLAGVQLMPSDVTAAIQAQNTQISAGQLGADPVPAGQQLNAIVTERSRLTTPDEFRRIVVKTNQDGSKVLLGDVARVELGSESYSVTSRENGHPASGIAIQLAPGADALATAKLVRKTVEQASKSFPDGYKVAYPNDITPFITLSVQEVVQTLFEAILLVVVVMFVFLQSWRATLIPAIAVPVVMLGTFGILSVAGYSINVLTLFGLVLSIGLLVDDAIVVVENVERVMAEDEDISPRDAALKSMEEIQTALIAIALVLSAVFLPMAFFGGSIGVIYRQFSITIVSSMVLSVVVALVLSPALAATLLKRPDKDKAATHGAGAWAKRQGNRFNAWFDRTADRYQRGVERVIANAWPAGLVYLGIVAVLVVTFVALPTGFLPNEDQGGAQVQFTLPPGATTARTLAAAGAIERYFIGHNKSTTQSMLTIMGSSNQGTGENTGRGFVKLLPWDQRTGKGEDALSLTQAATADLSPELRDVRFFALNPPAVRGAGAGERVHDGIAQYGRARPGDVQGAAERPAGADRARSGADGGAAEHPGRCADTRHRGRSREGWRARAGAGERRPDDQHRVGRHLCQRFRRPGAREARLCPGRRAISRAAGGSGELVCAHRNRHDGRPSRPSRTQNGGRPPLHSPGSTASPLTKSRATRRRANHRARRWTGWSKSRPSCPACRSRGAGCRSRRSCRAGRPRSSIPCRYSSSSCV